MRQTADLDLAPANLLEPVPRSGSRFAIGKDDPIEMNAFDDIARRLHPLVRETTRAAGAMAARFFRSGLKTSARVWSKSGGSPVTEADMAVDAFLKAELSRAAPEAGWLSEETADNPARLGRDLVWIVDPIDGTRAFAAGIHDWSVSVALLAAGRPILGIVYAPAHEALFEARRGNGAFRNGAAVSTSPFNRLRDASVAGPKSLVDRLEQGAGALKRAPRIPSLALRLVRVAEGSIDAGLVSSNACDWDIAAADLILEEAGGALTGFDGATPAYNQPEPIHGELLAASRRLHPRLIEVMTTPQSSGESVARLSGGRTSS
jgi:myo-inositol-1(or 4)-monophosphatase